MLPLVLLFACSRGDRLRARTINAHGLRLGDVVAPERVQCYGGPDRIVGDVAETQLITFSTMGDCSACVSHLAGLEQILATKQIDATQFYVSWAPKAEMAAALIGYRATTSRPVCFDTAGAMWQAYNISHTPVTVIVRQGRVVYMHDMPLLTAAEQHEFVADLRGFGLR